jgi:hypothetical protein
VFLWSSPADKTRVLMPAPPRSRAPSPLGRFAFRADLKLRVEEDTFGYFGLVKAQVKMSKGSSLGSGFDPSPESTVQVSCGRCVPT